MSELYRLQPTAPASNKAHTAAPPRFEYKVIGGGRIEVTHGGVTAHQPLDHALNAPNPSLVEAILNALGAEGWEIVTLDPPYVFRRPIAS